ncbi:hypothetical protein RIF29_12467 [Crotalaria pallida]|uniref:Uncharacterized protein n=1 Tax=Crotalaria pallida TaxID=3830 RepID=A0AAN9ING1_CROPI
MRTILTTTTSSLTYTDTSTTQRSTWHSPVPYLFGGLAAMLGLIAFALLILACSYWKLSGQLQNENEQRDLESGGGDGERESSGDPTASKKEIAMKKVYEEKVLVIMAGNDTPTFLATPANANSSSSFVNEVGNDCCDKNKGNREACEGSEKNMVGNVETTSTTTSQQQQSQQPHQ